MVELRKGLIVRVAPWQLTPLITELKVLLGTTWTAWFVTDPLLFATGAAVLET